MEVLYKKPVYGIYMIYFELYNAHRYVNVPMRITYYSKGFEVAELCKPRQHLQMLLLTSIPGPQHVLFNGSCSPPDPEII